MIELVRHGRAGQAMAGHGRAWQGRAGHDVALQGMQGVAHMAGSYHSYEASYFQAHITQPMTLNWPLFLNTKNTVFEA